jgi:hypothetical protein
MSSNFVLQKNAVLCCFTNLNVIVCHKKSLTFAEEENSKKKEGEKSMKKNKM